MSHYAKYKCLIDNAAALVDALVALGYDRSAVEVHKEPAALYNYCGAKQAQHCHVIVRRGSVGELCNDMGWLIDPTGKESSWHVCDYAVKRPQVLYNPKVKAMGGHNDKFVSRLGQEVNAAKAMRHYASQGKKVVRVDADDGKVLLYANS